MFAVGHMALGYLLGKASSVGLKVSLNIPAVLVLSIIPDIDILLGVEGFHRGPTHSAVVALLVFAPFFVVYRRKAVPYFLALLSHGLIGDLIVGGNVQLFWPISQSYVSVSPPLPKIAIDSATNVALELTLFAIAMIIMYMAKDLHVFFQNRKSNLLLTIPITTVLLPTFAAFPLTVPVALIPPHLFFLGLFITSVLLVIFRSLHKSKKSPGTAVLLGNQRMTDSRYRQIIKSCVLFSIIPEGEYGWKGLYHVGIMLMNLSKSRKKSFYGVLSDLRLLPRTSKN